MNIQFEVNRRVIKRLWLKEMFEPYWDEGLIYYPRKRRGTKQSYKRILAYQVRMYRTWKHNRKKQWKE